MAVTLSHAPDGRGYKLIELPPEVQALLQGPAPPVLTLVSDPAHPAALLKTTDKVYSLRQKNTSNALMILEPTCAVGEDTDTNVAGNGQPDGLDVVATVHETFELVPEAGDRAPVISQAKNPGSKGKWHERFGRNR